MDVVWGAESGAVRWVQGWGSWLEPLMQAVTALGSKALFVALLPLIFWSVHAGLGARLSLVLLGSATVNSVAKALLCAPRPYWYDPGIRPLSTESTFGAPSGHAQLSVTFWGYLAAQSARRAVRAGAAALIALVCLSRIYLGVHFFSDIALGLALGALLLWAALRYEEALLRRWRALSLPVQTALAVAASAVPVALVAAYQAVLRAGWSVPEEWAGAVPPDVAGEALAHTGALGGALLGAVAGFTVLDRRGWYSASGSLITRAARYVTGITGVLLILAVARLALPDTAGAAGEYALYLLISLWAALGAPELFVRLRMADRPDGDRAGATP
ncbi:phosphatase PAP2 family protein [Nocardiopsis potens]|uniref:phosphatase PAP2 family protein n=1 Tax=Nocardiopsis potens TaxID=1246458 RepID=UPI0003701F93|nr:phosphatase PAP2 family protein [Nocardiopsis potens]